MENQKRYIPALSFNWLTPLYDFVLSRLMHEEGFKRSLIDQARIQPGMQVLDLGCGTGTLTVMIKKAHPDAVVTGLDGDPEVLHIAERKAKEHGADTQFDRGLADDLPYPAGRFQRVLSSLVIHHLDHEQKLAAFKEVYRVLEPGGDFHLLDFGMPFSLYGRAISHLMIHFEETADNLHGRLPAMLLSAGFSNIQETRKMTTLFGDIRVYKAVV
jgi:ubiquinone/menaquinone biosynthesis C-methylase UbiE